LKSSSDLFFLNFLSDNSLKKREYKTVIKKKKKIRYSIGLAQQEWKTPFNAKRILNSSLKMSISTSGWKYIQFSATGVDSQFIGKINLTFKRSTNLPKPDRNKASKAYYEVSVKGPESRECWTFKTMQFMDLSGHDYEIVPGLIQDF